MDKIICVGKNYLKHAIELGDAVPESPIYFLKPPSTLLVVESGKVELPLSKRGEVHHELELVFRIEDDKLTHFTLGLDLTLRDLQTSLKKAGQPWEKAKVFANSSVLGPWHPVNSLEGLLKEPFELTVNGEKRQRGIGQDMRWGPLELLKDVANWFPIRNGDILFTGTPEGVGPLKPGDVLKIRGGPVEYGLTCV